MICCFVERCPLYGDCDRFTPYRKRRWNISESSEVPICPCKGYHYISKFMLKHFIMNNERHKILQIYSIDGKSYFIISIWLIISPIIYRFNICLWDVWISKSMPLVLAKMIVRSIISLRRPVLFFMSFSKSILKGSSLKLLSTCIVPGLDSSLSSKKSKGLCHFHLFQKMPYKFNQYIYVIRLSKYKLTQWIK